MKMFNNKCNKCNKNIKSNFDFCPHCGEILRSKNDDKDYGLLGKNDIMNEGNFLPRENTFVEKLFNNAIKMIEKQMKDMPELPRDATQPQRIPNNINVQFFVNGKKVFPDNVIQKQKQELPSIKIENKISRDRMKEFSGMPRIEANSKLKRIGGKVVYELEVPGVKRTEDVIINKLENSIEVKALSDDSVYFKILKVNLPILGYHLLDDTLFLELQAK